MKLLSLLIFLANVGCVIFNLYIGNYLMAVVNALAAVWIGVSYMNYREYIWELGGNATIISIWKVACWNNFLINMSIFSIFKRTLQSTEEKLIELRAELAEKEAHVKSYDRLFDSNDNISFHIFQEYTALVGEVARLKSLIKSLEAKGTQP